MTATIPIYSHNDMYVPTFRVKARRQDLDPVVMRDVISVTYTDSLDAFDSVDLVLNNWDDSRSGTRSPFTYCVDEQAAFPDLFTFDRSVVVETSLGYEGVGIVKVHEGTVESIEPHYPASGVPTVTVRVVNPLKALQDKPRVKVYLDKSAEDIARAIARDHDLEIEVHKESDDDDGPQEYVFQDNQFDIVFLRERARRIGYDIWLEGTTLHFGIASAGARSDTVYSLGYRRSLIDFAPRLSMNDQVGTVKVAARDQKSKGTFSGVATRAEVGLNADLEAFVTKEIRDKVKTVSGQPLHSNGQAKQLAREILRNVMQKMLTATVTAPGLPEIRAGRLVELTDVGSRFAGPYLVTSSTHTLDDSGYKTTFTARREKVS